MSKKFKIIGFAVLSLGILLAAVLYLHDKTFAVLSPKGTIASQERDLIIFCVLISLIIVIPVFGLTFFISWRYREGNTRAKKTYSPNWDGSRRLETAWWLIPTVIIVVISVVSWRTTHQLDPFRPIASHTKPITIQVVALDWKWLFIYPEQHIATVNYVKFPEQTPLNFQITADAPMNSFWIPQLGGQIYAMAGMSTQMHLMADSAGDYRGSSANISGQGFAGMKFMAESRSQTDFDSWVRSVQATDTVLNHTTYNELAQPSEDHPAADYGSVASGLYDKILAKYMMPADQLPGAETL